GWGQLGIQSNGLTSFRGHVHEDSSFVGDNYVLSAVLLDVADSSGKTPAFAQTGSLAGQLSPGSSDKDWQRDRKVDFIAAQWNAAKVGRVQWRLHASTDPIQVVTLVIPGGSVIGSLFVNS